MAPSFPAPPRRHALALVLAVLVPPLLILACQADEPLAPEPPLPARETPLVLAPGQLVVSLTLDDNRASQADAALLLCRQRGGFGTNSFSWARTTDAHSGSWAQRLSVTSYSSGDRKLISLQDLGTCAPPLTPGHRYKVSAWYKSTAAPLFKAYYRNSSGGWRWWAQSALLPTRGAYGFAEWTTPPRRRAPWASAWGSPWSAWARLPWMTSP